MGVAGQQRGDRLEVLPVGLQGVRRGFAGAAVGQELFEPLWAPTVSPVGNVPFGRFVVHDPAHNAARHSIHNHFINKLLALTAPGGYVAVLTSRYTMDSTSDAARRDIAERGELIGALRLPSRALSRVAGTEVVTDLLVLRRRTEPVDPCAPSARCGWTWRGSPSTPTPTPTAPPRP